MSTQDIPNVPGVEVSIDPSDLMSRINEFLDGLVPDKSANVCDITGAGHKLNFAFPAAIEVRMLRRVERIQQDLAESEDGEVVMAAIAAGDGLSGMMDAFMQAITQPKVFDALVEMFGFLHPGAVEAAKQNVLANTELVNMLVTMCELEGPHQLNAGHFFDSDQMIRGVSPFAISVARKLIKGLNLATQATGLLGSTTE